jgi:hypothetical protein
MGGGAFILLKDARAGPKSAKQAEIRLAIFLKILPIARSGAEALAKAGKGVRWAVFATIFMGYD